VQIIDHSYQTLYSELAQRALDGSFTSEFSTSGRFITMEVKGRRYWYFDEPREDGKKRLYVGPADDLEITRRVEAFKDLKADIKVRRKIVATLVREAYLPRPGMDAGDVVEALANAGFFRLRGVLVGTVAYQCYSAVLGVRLPATAMQTADADFAQFHSISAAVNDEMPPIKAVLQSVDATFREVPHQSDSRYTTKFVARSGYQVEFLTPTTRSAEYIGHPTPMPALGNTAAEPLRFLDFLIYQPVRAILLHRAGVPVLVPAPARYVVHKLIVATRRNHDDTGTSKSRKDRIQAVALAEAMVATRQQDALAEAYLEAYARGPHWQDAINASLRALDDHQRTIFADGLAKGVRDLGEDPRSYGL
jgi:hypothetical protein